MNLPTLIKISRPRFWLYAGGTFLVGAIAGAGSIFDLQSWQVLIYFLYFMIPANIFIYGVNDLYDDDTDPYNEKKGQQEHLLVQQESSWVRRWVWLCIASGIVLVLLAPNLPAKILIAVFLFLAWAYSAKPLRFKAKPAIDAISNVHYAVIGFAGYAMLSGDWPPIWAVVAAWCWTAAMHIFSAIPDIDADSQANLQTTAVVLGQKAALALCTGLWMITFVALFVGDFWLPWSALLAVVYPIISASLLGQPITVIRKVYWYFPFINALVGLVLFWVITISKFHA